MRTPVISPYNMARPYVGTSNHTSNITTANTVPRNYDGSSQLGFGMNASTSTVLKVVGGILFGLFTLSLLPGCGGGPGGTGGGGGGGGTGKTASQLFVAKETARNVKNPHVYGKQSYDDPSYNTQVKNIRLSKEGEPPVYLTAEYNPVYKTTGYNRDNYFAAKVDGYTSNVLAETSEVLEEVEVPEGTTPPANSFSVTMEDGKVKTFIPTGEQFNYIYDEVKNEKGEIEYSRRLKWDGSKYVPDKGQLKYQDGIINELRPNGTIYNKLKNVIIDNEQASIKKPVKQNLADAGKAIVRWCKGKSIKPGAVV